jgi:hypothetical protein
MGSTFSSIRSGCPSHLSFLSFFLSIRHAHKYGALSSFLCQVMCCARSPLPTPSLLLPYPSWYCHCLQCQRLTRGTRWGANAAPLVQRWGGGMEGQGGGGGASLPRCILGLALYALTALIMMACTWALRCSGRLTALLAMLAATLWHHAVHQGTVSSS